MAHMNLGGRLALVTGVCQLVLAFQPHSLPAEELTNRQQELAATAAEPAAAEGVCGIASYYASRYDRRRTTSGTRYDPAKLTAAHADLPLGSRVRVVNLANKREVVVTVNDRCRRKKSAFIDLSREVARQLGFLGKGIARVRIIPLDDEEPT